ncbi:MAG: PRC-barrel domain-containing protein [Nitrosospira sp.]|nr:PRC-barrel domain-containing protein [Nitrosospira sp.]
MNSSSKMNIVASVLVLSVGFALSGPTYAADPPEVIPDVEPQQAAQPRSQLRVSKLIGSEVRNVRGETLGEIDDLIVDMNNERVHYAVLSFGGFLGVGNKLLAYPVEAFRHSEDEDGLILNTSEEKLKGAPGFEQGRYPDWNDRTYREQVDRYHGATASRHPESNQMLRPASELMGREINDRKGEDMGEITDLVVDMRDGKIPYAVFSFDKLWDVNERAILISPRSFNLPASGDGTLDVDRSKLDNALDFEKNRWPNVNNPLFLVDVEGYLVLVDPHEYSAEGSAVAVFARLDLNQDNRLTPEEARQDSKVFGAWTQFDARGAGTVTRREFLSRYKDIVK